MGVENQPTFGSAALPKALSRRSKLLTTFTASSERHDRNTAICTLGGWSERPASRAKSSHRTRHEWNALPRFTEKSSFSGGIFGRWDPTTRVSLSPVGCAMFEFSVPRRPERTHTARRSERNCLGPRVKHKPTGDGICVASQSWRGQRHLLRVSGDSRQPRTGCRYCGI